MKKGLLVLGGIAVFLFLWAISAYNGLVTGNQSVDAQWAQVETQYQRRFDLIPNLVESVKGVLKQEQTIFKDIADARSRYAGATTVDEKSAAATSVESSLGRLLVIMENYPELKSDTTVVRLMDELAGTENRISVERRRFNETVSEYNLKVIRFPGSLLANLFGFKQRQFFQAQDGADTAPSVKLDITN